MKSGESLTLFDNSINLDIELVDQTFSTKNKLFGSITRIESNKKILPEIILMPCILKRDAFEEIIYAAAQMAVTKIIPLISAKVQRSWGGNKEMERMTNIMISACEQSKSFIIPELNSPVKIQDISRHLENQKSIIKAYFDPAGQNIFTLLKTLDQKNKPAVALLFGPEGGLTNDEEKIIAGAGFETYALTPTILRSREAVFVGLGSVRSVAR